MKNLIAVTAACAVFSSMPAKAAGADLQFPHRPVRLIVPTPPSGGTDFLARLLAQKLAERWGQNVVVDNRAGATGVIAFEILAHASPDGHMLALGNVGHTLSAQLATRLSFERGGDFTPIALPATSVLLLVVYSGVQAKSVKELVELARNAKPRLLYASGGTGSVSHLTMELFRRMVGIELTHVPYKGAAPSLLDVVSGQVQFTMTTVAAAAPHLQTGRVRALAITGAKRAQGVPEVPTFIEAGYPRYDVTVWYGIFAPARAPARVAAQLNADFNRAVRQLGMAEQLAGAGIDPAGELSPSRFADYISTEVVKWNEGLKAAGMR